MRITIAGHAGTPDVDVEVPEDVRLGELRPQLAVATGRPELALQAAGTSGAELAVDDVALDDDHLTGRPPLLPGVSVRLGRGSPDPELVALRSGWHLAVVSGPDAGALVALDGPVVVGHAGAAARAAGGRSRPAPTAGRTDDGVGGGLVGPPPDGVAPAGGTRRRATTSRSGRAPTPRGGRAARRLDLDDPAVSARHLVVEPGQRRGRGGTPAPTARDLGSRNGTGLVRTRRRTRTGRVGSARRRLAAGDRLVLGGTVLELRAAGEAGRPLRAPDGGPSSRSPAGSPRAAPGSRTAASAWLAGVLGGVVFAAATGNALMLALAAVGPVTAACGWLVDRAVGRRARRPSAAHGPVRGWSRRPGPRSTTLPTTGPVDVPAASAADLRTAVLVELAARVGCPVVGTADGGPAGGVDDEAGRRSSPAEANGLHGLAPDGCVAVVGPRDRTLAVARLLACAHVTTRVADGGPPVRLEVWAHEGDADAWSWCRWLRPETGTPPSEPGAEPEPAAAGVVLLVVDGMDGAVPAPASSGARSAAAGSARSASLALLHARAGSGRGLGVLVVEDDVRRVPAWCRTRVHVPEADGAGVVARSDGTVARPAVSGVSVAWAERQARLVAAVRPRRSPDDAGRAADHRSAVLPRTVALADLPGIPSPDADAVLRAWGLGPSAAGPPPRACPPPGADPRPGADPPPPVGPAVPGGLVARLGVGVGGPMLLDLVRDGPHGLVAGTTGAGKSELLQTWVLSLALTRSPAELAVLLVDYKGGAGLGACTGLPHVVGQVTDLDPALAARALTGLRAELRRRERLLARWGVPDLAALRARAPGAAPPRLLVVVDEFRALVDDLPGFVPGLLRVAAQGRSLGVHLILATQRPGGAVGPDLRANLALRVCLRVTDSADSLDVLDLPDAARIPPAMAGRALLRRGPGGLEPVQVALADGSPSTRAAPVRRASTGPLAAGAPDRVAPATGAPPGRMAGSMTGAWVAATRTAAERAGLTTPDVPWLPELPAAVPLTELRSRARPPSGSPHPGPPASAAGPGPRHPDAPLAFALADRPAEQRRDVVAWRPWSGPLLVIGATASGRTTTLRTLAAVGVAQGWWVHTVSAGTPVLDGDTCPALGTCASADDPRLVSRLITLLGAPAAAHRPDVPHLLLVDGLDTVLDALGPVARGRAADRLVDLVRDGRRRGVCVAATAPPTVSPGVAAHFTDRLVLRVGDRVADTMAGVPPDLAGSRRPAGRAVWLPAGDDALRQGSSGDAGRSPDDATPHDATPHDPTSGDATSGDGEPDGPALCQVALGVPSPAAPTPPSTTVRLRPVPHVVTVHDLGPTGTSAPRPAVPVGPGGDHAGPAPVPVGLGGDHAGPVRLRLDRGALVVGPPGSGRSTALAVVLHGLLAGDHAVLVVARDGPLRDLGDCHLPDRTCGFGARELDAAIDALLEDPGDVRPAVVVVDDLDALEQADPAGSVRLASLAPTDRAASRPVRLVASARTATACMSFRGPLGMLRTVRRGLVLGPQDPGSSEVFGVDVTWDADPVRPHDPGRGVVVHGRETVPVQVADLAHPGST